MVVRGLIRRVTRIQLAAGIAVVVGVSSYPVLARAASVDIGRAEGEAGTTVSFDVSLRGGGGKIVATVNQISFDAAAEVDTTADGKPDCSLNPALPKEHTGFAFQPRNCAPGASCTSMKAVVISLNPSTAKLPIPDGPLYTCRFTIPDTGAPGKVFSLTTVRAVVTESDNTDIDVTGQSQNGMVRVSGEARPVAGGRAPVGAGGVPSVEAPGGVRPAAPAPAAPPAAPRAPAPAAQPAVAAPTFGAPEAGATPVPTVVTSTTPVGTAGVPSPRSTEVSAVTPSPEVTRAPTTKPTAVKSPAPARAAAASGGNAGEPEAKKCACQLRAPEHGHDGAAGLLLALGLLIWRRRRHQSTARTRPRR